MVSMNNVNDYLLIFSGNGIVVGGVVYNGDNNSKWFLFFVGNNVDSSSRYGLNLVEVEVGMFRLFVLVKICCIEVFRLFCVGMFLLLLGVSLVVGVEEISLSYFVIFFVILFVILCFVSVFGLVFF